MTTPRRKIISKLRLGEISFVDNPAQTGALVTILKSADHNIEDIFAATARGPVAMAELAALAAKLNKQEKTEMTLKSEVQKYRDANPDATEAMATDAVLTANPSLYDAMEKAEIQLSDAERRKADADMALAQDDEREIRAAVAKRRERYDESEHVARMRVLSEHPEMYDIAESRRAARQANADRLTYR